VAEINNTISILKNIKKTKDFFIGIDSDGCVLDSMRIKHCECFCPNTISHFDLQPVSKYAIETWEYLNLYSKRAGGNRFLGLIEFFDVLKGRKEVKKLNLQFIDLSPLIEWAGKAEKLSTVSLRDHAAIVKNEIIDRVLLWAFDIDEDIKKKSGSIKPFQFAEEAISEIKKHADVTIISHAPVETIRREWDACALLQYADFIAGQEYGTKSEKLRIIAKGRYDDNRIMMIGDAWKDLEAAEDNGVLFYPINPGKEKDSWERFYKEALGKFLGGTYTGNYERILIGEFDKCLPDKPFWEN
jgi:phosphoglycolate phosphatase-like HAD superfamily hydrolase